MLKITNIEVLKENFYILKAIMQDEREVLPGNFFMLKAGTDVNPLLNRPFSVMDVKGNNIYFLIKEIGKGTKLLKKKNKDEEIFALGPLGNSFMNFINGNKKIFLIGGGTGIAPLFFLSKTLRNMGRNYTLIYGAKSKSQLVIKPHIEMENLNVIYFTEDGSFGKKGLVTDFVRNIKENSIIISCGPKMMMKNIEGLISSNIKHYVSLESVMACGFGVCLGCVIPTKLEGYEKYQRVCKDGPIFDAKIINWEKF